MAFDFPNSPTEGQVFAPAGGPIYQYQSPKWVTSEDLSLSMVTATGSTTARSIADHVSAPVNVKNFGAIGNGVANDYAAFAAAIASTHGPIYVPEGTYNVGSPIVVNRDDVKFIGAGSTFTKIIATHNSGPVFRFSEFGGGIARLNIGASPARNAGSNGGATMAANVGVMVAGVTAAEATASGGSPTNAYYFTAEDFLIVDQPSHGMCIVGNSYFADIHVFEIRYNKGHGLVFDNGYSFGRRNTTGPTVTNLKRPGIGHVNVGRIRDNLGHGVMVGGFSEDLNLAFRLEIKNIDSFRNAVYAVHPITSVPSPRKELTDWWIWTENSNLELNAVSGFLPLNTGPPPSEVGDVVIAGLSVGGRCVRIVNNRFIQVKDRAIIINAGPEIGTRDITVDSMLITSSVDPDGTGTIPPIAVDVGVAVECRPGAQRIGVSNQNSQGWNRLLAMQDGTDVPGGTINFHEFILKRSAQTVNNSATLVNDTYLKFPIDEGERLEFRCHIPHDGNSTANLKCTFTGPTGCMIRFMSESGLYVNSADTISIDGMRIEGGLFTVGAATSVRTFTLYGICTNPDSVSSGVAGTIQFKWAQNTATAVDTRVIGGDTGGAYIEVFRGLR